MQSLVDVLFKINREGNNHKKNEEIFDYLNLPQEDEEDEN